MVVGECAGHMGSRQSRSRVQRAILVQAMASSFRSSSLEEIVKKAGQDPRRCLLQSLALVV